MMLGDKHPITRRDLLLCGPGDCDCSGNLVCVGATGGKSARAMNNAAVMSRRMIAGSCITGTSSN